jgi:citrate synthase
MWGKMADALYLNAEETAEQLQISLTSVYAYVSRGLIRSQKIPGSKKRVYWRADVDKLRSDGLATNGPDSMPAKLVETTQITLLTSAGHYYRGRSALELARTETLEDVAALLWQVDKDLAFRDELPRVTSEALRPRERDDTIWQRTMKLLFAIERSDPRAYNLTRDGYCRSGADALRCVAAACLDRTEFSTKPIHEQICDTLGTGDRFKNIVRTYLVLAADHELDPTTYSVRAAANTGVTPYAAIAAGLLSSSGRRLVFGQTGSVSRLFEELEDTSDPTLPLMRRLRSGETIPGFASLPYPNGDPRASMLLDQLRETCGNDRDFVRLEGAIATVHDATGSKPGLVIPALFLERKLGMKTDQTTLLRLARVVGWIAHAIEQYYESDLVRPHAAYAGNLPEPVVAS